MSNEFDARDFIIKAEDLKTLRNIPARLVFCAAGVISIAINGRDVALLDSSDSKKLYKEMKKYFELDGNACTHEFEKVDMIGIGPDYSYDRCVKCGFIPSIWDDCVLKADFE